MNSTRVPVVVPIRHQSLWSEGQSYAAQGRWEPALRCFARIVAEDPGNVAAAIQHTLLLLQVDRYQAAHAGLLRVAEDQVTAAELTLEIAKLLRRFEESQRLRQLVSRSNYIACDSPYLLTEMARLLSASGQHDEALRLLDASGRIDGQQPATHYLRGAILMFAGEMEASVRELERALAMAPHLPHAHWMLSLLGKDAADQGSVARIEAARRVTESGSEGAAYLAYALHNRQHALGHYDQAWNALQDAWQVKRELVRYRRDEHAALFDALRRTCTREFVLPVGTDSGLRPIFIVGMHRSGTTLLERVLGGHSQVTDGGETYGFTAQLRLAMDHDCRGVLDAMTVARAPVADFKRIGQGFLEAARWRAGGKPCMTEKLPSNFLNIGFILKALPDARILHMVRDPLDTCFSNLRTFYTQAAPYSYDQCDMAEYYLSYRRLMAHWHQVAPGRILDVDYDAFVCDPEAMTRKVTAFCGLPFEPSVLDVGRASGVVVTASTPEVRGGIRTDRGAAWKPYEQYLGPLIRALEPLYR